MIALLPVALLILAVYGVYAIISATFNPWHLLLFATAPTAVLLALVLVFRLASAAIERWKNRK